MDTLLLTEIYNKRDNSLILNKVGTFLRSKTDWILRNIPTGTDKYKFNALPAGYCKEDGTCIMMRETSYFWSSTLVSANSTNAYYYRIVNDDEGLFSAYHDKENKRSVRCVRDAN